jgi:hypothetical protein
MTSLGSPIHVGARISALAGAGEVLVSSTVKDLVVGSGLAFDDRGSRDRDPRRLFGLESALDALAVAIGERAGGDEPIAHVLHLLEGEAVKEFRPLANHRSVEGGDPPGALRRHLDQHATPVLGIAHALDESLALESVDERRRGWRRQPGPGTELAGRFRAICQPVEAAHICRIQVQSPPDGIVEGLDAALICLHRIPGFGVQGLTPLAHPHILRLTKHAIYE